MSSNVNHGEEDGLEEFSGTGGAGSVCEPWSSLLSSEDSSTTGVEVLGSSVLWPLEDQKYLHIETLSLKKFVQMNENYLWRVNFLLKLNLSHYFENQYANNGIGKPELCLSLEVQELL